MENPDDELHEVNPEFTDALMEGIAGFTDVQERVLPGYINGKTVKSFVSQDWGSQYEIRFTDGSVLSIYQVYEEINFDFCIESKPK